MFCLARGEVLRGFPGDFRHGSLRSGVFSPREARVKREKCRGIAVLRVLCGGSTMPIVVTSPVGCPRFSVSQAVSSGLVPEVLDMDCRSRVRLHSSTFCGGLRRRGNSRRRLPGMRRVLNATALRVASLLPLLSGRRLHVLHTSRVGWPSDVGLEKATTAYVAFRASTGSARLGGAVAGFLRAIRGSGDVWGMFSPRGHRMETRNRRVIFDFRVLHEGGASALVTLMERIAHEVDMFYVVNVLCVLWFGRAVLRGGHVMGPFTCGFSPFFSTWLAVLLPTRLTFASKACSLGSDLPVWLKA
ncbi:hypothetical protein Taro_036477 [Colocasia esculenta]|uniref:Uncharacterized protein n=1 Tax=Colocasia esculenta TaxID=4460 RepID=A0A843W1P1_COLES|nr:hypothetical protein [Colocasia esculenta]